MNKKAVTFRINPTIIKKLKFVALENDRTLTDILLEGIEYLLKKYEKKDK